MRDSGMFGLSRRGGSTIGWILGVATLAIVMSSLLFPMFAKVNRHSPGTNCQSNLNQIGKAIKTYLSDWDGYYPTNRQRFSSGEFGPISSSVKPSKVGVDEDGKPYRFENGVTWVEGLYNYMEPITTQDDNSSVWKCPVVTEADHKPTSDSAAVTYVMNRNLTERPEKDVRYAANLMLARETDRLVDSDLRPVNNSSTKDRAPISAFLTESDRYMGVTKSDLHSTGSNVLFADGHVKLISKTALPDKCTWDPETKTWGNADGSVMVSP